MSRLYKLHQQIRNRFSEELAQAFKERFEGLCVETRWNVIDMHSASFRTDGKRFSKEQRTFVEAFSIGYSAASSQVHP